MIEEKDSLEDSRRWDYLHNHPDLAKREAFRLWNKKPNSLTKKQRLLITELLKQ